MKNNKTFLRHIFVRGYRSDGTWVKDIDPIQRLEPFLFRTRNEASVYFKEKIDITHTMEYIKRRNMNKEVEKISLFHILIAAMVRTAAMKPKLNRFIARKRTYQRNKMYISYLVKQKMTEEAKAIVVKNSFDSSDTIDTIASRVRTSIECARTKSIAESENLVKTFSKMPGWVISFVISVLRCLDFFGLMPEKMIKADPFYASAFLANLGSLGINAPYHHLYEWGTVSLFVAMGMYYDEMSYTAAGNEKRKTFVDITFTVDERIADGFYLAKALQTFTHFMKNPEELEHRMEGETPID